jgi:hypothetical protein
MLEGSHINGPGQNWPPLAIMNWFMTKLWLSWKVMSVFGAGLFYGRCCIYCTYLYISGLREINHYQSMDCAFLQSHGSVKNQFVFNGGG